MKDNYGTPVRSSGGGSTINSKDAVGDDRGHIASPNYRLFQAIHDSAWEDVIRILKRDPVQASGWAIKNNEVPDLVTSVGGVKPPTPNRHNYMFDHQEQANAGNANTSLASTNKAWKRLPLHEALTRHPPLGAIEALLKAYPEGAKYPDHQNRLPLQVACVHGASKRVIIKLLTSFPESVLHRDSYGKTAAMSAEACPSFHDTTERNEITEALCQSPTHWYIYKENEKCRMEKDKEIEQLKLQFEKEREEFKAKAERIQRRATDERIEFFQTKENLNLRIEELSIEKSQMTRRIETLKQEKVDVRLELEGHIASREMELAVLRTELADCKNSSAVLTKIDGMQQKLSAAMQRNNELEDEMAVLTKDTADFAVQLEEKAKCETELQSYSQELFAELEETLKEKNQLEEELEVCKEERNTLSETLVQEREKFKKTLKDELEILHSKYANEISELNTESDKKIYELESSLMESNMATELLETTSAQDKVMLSAKASEIARLSKQLSDARCKEHDDNEKIWALQVEIKVLQNENEKEKRQFALAYSDYKNDLKCRESVEERWKEAEARCNSEKNRRIEAERERDNAQAEISRLSQSEATLQKQISQLEMKATNAESHRTECLPVSSLSSSTPGRRPEPSKLTSPVSVVSCADAPKNLSKAGTDISTTKATPAVDTKIVNADDEVQAGDVIDLDSLSPFERARLAFGKGKGTTTKNKTAKSCKISATIPIGPPTPFTKENPSSPTSLIDESPTPFTKENPSSPTSLIDEKANHAPASQSEESNVRNQYEMEVKALQEAFAALEARMRKNDMGK